MGVDPLTGFYILAVVGVAFDVLFAAWAIRKIRRALSDD